MKLIEQPDEHGRKILRVKQSPEELHEELMRLQEKHLKWLSMRRTVRSLESVDSEPQREQK